jgi:hypothetical protein
MSAIPHTVTVANNEHVEQLLLISHEGLRIPFTLSFVGYHLDVAMLEEAPDKQLLIYFRKCKLSPSELLTSHTNDLLDETLVHIRIKNY